MCLKLLPEQRIRKQEEFRVVIEQGRFARGRYVHLWSFFDKEKTLKKQTQKPRIGIIVSKKAHRKANKRNLWKRRIREAFRNNQRKIKNKENIIIQARRGPLLPGYKEIEEEVFELLNKTSSLKGN